MQTGDSYYKRSRCRACENEELDMFLSLGPTPLANSFLDSSNQFSNEKQYPLDVYFCRNCSLVQLLDVIDPKVLFRDYIYVTGSSGTILEHNKEYAAHVAGLMNLKPGQKVAEVASNNGQLLQCFVELGIDVLGIEPATNIAKIANDAGIKTVNEFFGRDTAIDLREKHGTFRAIIGNNVLAHVDETIDFLVGCREMIDDDGRVIFEVPYLAEFLERLEYDTVYHEHLCYFSVSSLARLCEAAGLRIAKVDHRSIHGGSLRVQAVKEEFANSHSDDALRYIEQETEAGLHDFSTYTAFAGKVEANRKQTLELLKSLKKSGAKIAGYGAAAKGNTFLNYCGIGTDLLDFAVDKNTLKVGKFTPGMHLPVCDVSAILERRPDYLLILAWNFADEIMKQQSAFRKSGGKFIVALPEPRVIS